MSRVLVAGATGALGRELVDALAERGHAVYAMARSTDDRRLEPHRRAISEVRVGDVTDPASLPAALDGAEIVVSTVGLTRPTHGVDFEDVDYRGNLALLDAAAAAGARRFVFVSLANLDDPAADHVPVVAAKRRFEAALRAGPVPWSIPRPSGFFWNYGVLLGQARSHGAVYLFGDGDARSTPIHETDLAAAIADRLELESAAYSVGGPEDLSYNDVAALIFRALDRPAKVHHLPRPVVRAGVTAMRPILPSKYGTAAFASWVLTHDATAERLGERRLGEWLVANRERDFGPL